jgi:Family of unknown function (DUF6065)
MPQDGRVMKLIAYTLGFPPSQMRPGPAQRPWMDATSDRYAYRCLPLNIANQYGWELLCPCSFEATWDGGAGPDNMVVEILEEGWPHPTSHFGHGVLTFHVNQLFRTPPGVQLMTTGPMNQPKDGIQALTGIIETDWSHYTFTMNWVMTRPFHPVRFEKGEPFAHIFPVNLAQIEQVEPQFVPIDADPDLKAAYETWQDSRNAFNRDLENPDSQARKDKWQKAYFRGLGPDAEPVDGCPMGHDKAVVQHWTKLDVQPWPGAGAKGKKR